MFTATCIQRLGEVHVNVYHLPCDYGTKEDAIQAAQEEARSLPWGATHIGWSEYREGKLWDHGTESI